MSADLPTKDFVARLTSALDARQALLEDLHAEGTDAYRLFHGSAEGLPGLTVDRYGEVILAQSFHRTLEVREYDALRQFCADAFPDTFLIWNDRSQPNSRVANVLSEAEAARAATPSVFRELGVRYRFQARHAGQDPWLFLDLRAGRRWLMRNAPDASLLNLFAYTCGAGVAAAKAGARHVVNVDFSESALAVGKDNAALNDLPIRVRFVKSDVFPVVRQFAGIGQPRRVRGKRMPPFPEFEPRRFDIVLLDPPRYAKSLFGVVDLVNDYAAVFKPALLATAEGGRIMCCNNVASVDRDAWVDQLERSARKAGRVVREIELLEPEADFPSSDGRPPLKMAVLHV